MKTVMADSIQQRINGLDWGKIQQQLWNSGYSLTEPVLSRTECAELIGMYPDDKRFCSHINMAQHRFGSGDYKYFAHPLPEIIADLRTDTYHHLAPVANEWNEALGVQSRFPAEHANLLKLCAAHGQIKPTPLLLHYEAGDYNCLHQDLYGEIAFPLQATVFLSRRDEDYTGGESVLVEQQPRAQSKAEVIAPHQGQMLIFTTRCRPVKGTRGYYRVSVRHGVSRVRSGVRFTLGVIFHDAA